jgi:hypothetical protein
MNKFLQNKNNLNYNFMETKQCPFCGERILAVAKKCKHCGEWLEEPKQESRPPVKTQTVNQLPGWIKALGVYPKAGINFNNYFTLAWGGIIYIVMAFISFGIAVSSEFESTSFMWINLVTLPLYLLLLWNLKVAAEDNDVNLNVRSSFKVWILSIIVFYILGVIPEGLDIDIFLAPLNKASSTFLVIGYLIFGIKLMKNKEFKIVGLAFITYFVGNVIGVICLFASDYPEDWVTIILFIVAATVSLTVLAILPVLYNYLSAPVSETTEKEG